MPFSKRFFDIVVSALLLLILTPVIALVAILILVLDGKPVFYLSERMHAPGVPFRLIKFRTMTVVEGDTGVSGGDKSQRVTRTGARLRQTRLDELPQLVNVLLGDMSLVGPRPPLRQYADRFPALYADVLRSSPGITGLASLHYHRHEEMLLGKCRDSAETDLVYCRDCIPRKARLDLIYQAHQSLCFDVAIITRTVLHKLAGR
ncbi:sugar transferase (plasmid) [Sphingomonadaceae bacterium OTU29LAMAA1]|nr:sugar transferase [Sphingomonadaceae bacterium OTU29LAMAA1]